MSQAAAGPPTARTKVRRLADRGRYDAATIRAILDEGFVAHVGFQSDHGPVVLPMAYAREGDDLYLHGATGNHLLRSLGTGTPICVTVTLLDGVVVSRSAFHHSLNYRSVVVYGTAEAVTDPAAKEHALLAVVDHVIPGRSGACRAPTPKELQATTVVRLPLAEASAKVRAGGPKEDPADLALEHWAGVIPLAVQPGAPEPDADLDAGIGVPEHVRDWARPATTLT